MSCAGCSTKWGGFKTCHCTACHETFSTISNFDRHRKTGKCQPPKDCGLVRRENGAWCMPSDGHSFRDAKATSHDHGSEGVGMAVLDDRGV